MSAANDNVYKKSVTSNTDEDSVNDSSLSDAIADILDLSVEEKEPVKITQDRVCPGLRELPHTSAKPPIYPRNLATAEYILSSSGDDNTDNDEDTPPMPEVYLSSESLELQASLESLSRSSEERCEYEGDFEDCETDSTATGFDIPSICSSPCQSTHDLSLLSDDDLFEQGDLDYWEEVTYNFVASNESHDTHVASDDTNNQMMSPSIPNMSPDISLDNDLEGEAYSGENAEVCFSNKSSFAVLPKDASRNSPTDEEDKAVVQESPIASDGMNNQNMPLIAKPESLVASEDTDNQKMEPTATSFHFSKEEQTTISETSSITEEIESSISENESLAASTTDNMRSEDATSLEGVEYTISTNNKDISEGTFQDESSISSSESPITEDVSVADNDLKGKVDYWENAEVCFSNKSSLAVLPKDPGQISSTDSDNNEEDKAVAQESHIASDDINNHNVPLIAQTEPLVASEDTDCQKMEATATSFHFSKEEPTSRSETSSITEEIESSISENESFAAVDLKTIQPIIDNIRSEDAASLEEVEYSISTNNKDSSEGTFQDESSISSSESPITEDVSVSDNDLKGKVNYWENAEVCFSNKSSLAVLPNDSGQISSTDSDNNEEDKAVAQESPIASDDINNQNIFPIATLDSPVGSDDTNSLKMTPTATPFHFSKEESTSVSETSSINEEIESSISENELSATVDLMEIQPDTDAILPEAVDILPGVELTISPISTKAPRLNEDTSLFSSTPSGELSIIQEGVSHVSSSETSVSVNLIPSSLESINMTDSSCSLPDLSDTKEPKTICSAIVSAASKLLGDEDKICYIPTGEVTSGESDVENPELSIETSSSSFSLDLDDINIDTSHVGEFSKPALLTNSEASTRLSDALTSNPIKPNTTIADEDYIKEENDDVIKSILKDRSRLQDEIKQLTSKCDHLDQDKRRLSSDLSTFKIEIHELANEKQSISEEAQAQLKASTDIIKAKNTAIKALEDDVLRCTSEAELFKDENMSLLADVQTLQSTVDKQNIVAETLLQENTALKQDAEKVILLSQDEKQALKEMSSMTDELIDENSELKIKLETTTEELDELVWQSKEREEYNLLLEELLNESDREAAGSRKDSDKINYALEMENALLHAKIHHLQSQSRNERKSSYQIGTRKLKAIQDLERRLIDLKSENNTLNGHLLAEQSKSDFNQSTIEELQKREENQRMENQALREQLETSNKHEVDLRNELAEKNRLLQESEDSYCDYQAIVANNNKLMVQIATLQGFIEQRRIGLSCGNGSSGGCKSGLPLDASSGPSVTSSMTTEPDQEVHQMATSETPDELGPIFSLQESISLMFEEQNRKLTSFNQLLVGEVQDMKSQLAETPDELGPIFSLQESMSLMFEEQNRQLTSVNQLLIGEVQDVKSQLAEINSTKSVTIVGREEEVETDATFDMFAATNAEEISNFSARVATLEGEVESLKNKITIVNTINSQTVALSLQKDSKIECLLEAVDALTAKNNKLKHEKNKWKDMVEESQLTMAELKEQNINEVSFIGEQYNHYKTKTDQLIDTIKADLYNREKELEAAEHKFRMSNIAARQLPGLEEHLKAAEKTITFLSVALDEKSKTCRRLQEETAETDVAGLRERNKDLAGDLAEVEQKLKNIRQEKQVLKGSIAKADLKLMNMELDLASADRVKHGKNYLNITQQDYLNKHTEQTVINIGEEREAKTCAKCAGDTAKAHRIEQVSKEPQRTAIESKALSEGWSTANIMVVSKEGMMKTMFEEQEQRLKAFMQNNMEKSNNQIDNLRKKLRKMMYQAAGSKCTFEKPDKTTDDDDSNDLTETQSDVTSASYHSTQSTEDAVTSASVSDVTVYQEPITEQHVENNFVDTEETDIKRGLV